MGSETVEKLLPVGEWLKARNFYSATVTPETHRRVNARPEHACAIDLAGVFSWSRPFDKAILPTDLFELLHAADAIYPDGPWWRCRYRFSTIGGHGFFHSAYPTETEDSVFLGPDTNRFITAVETELAKGSQSWTRAADVGTGSGAAGILLARQNPSATVVLTDINEKAIGLSEVNARLAHADNVSFCVCSLLDGLTGSFDLIVANPPYLLDAWQRTYRHGGGDRGEGLSLNILDLALDRLAPDGRLLLYTGSAIVAGVDHLLVKIGTRLRDSQAKWSYRELDPDVFGEETDALGADRIAAVFLSITKAG